MKRRCCFCATARLTPETPVKPTTSAPVVRARAFRRIVANQQSHSHHCGGMFSMATPSARTHATTAVQPANATSSVHLTLHRLERVVEQMTTRLSRLEHRHWVPSPSHRRRQGRVVMSPVVQFMSAADHVLGNRGTAGRAGRSSRGVSSTSRHPGSPRGGECRDAIRWR